MSDGNENAGTLKLRNGRRIHAVSVRQHKIYAGLLEGMPTRNRNAELVEAAVRDAQKTFGDAPYLIAPVERAIPYEGRYPFGEPAALPETLCVARFDSHHFELGPERERNGSFASSLTIVWFQHAFAFPIDVAIAEHIRAMSWEDHAHAFEV